MEARYYKQIGNEVQCALCPHECRIKSGNTGICKVRRNNEGRLITENYSKLSAIHLDPIEKKPLYHFHPGKFILSIGSMGCNMHCSCCQNWQISQSPADGFPFGDLYKPEQIASLALSHRNNIGIAYTYNEPVVWFEYMLDTAVLIKQNGMKNVVVSNGYINAEPLNELLNYTDAFNIDLKAFSGKFYRSITGAKLEPVLTALQMISKAKKHLEITCLIIPSLNDDPMDFKEMVSWIAGKLGSHTVLHLSRYHPAYKMEEDSTPSLTLEKLYAIAAKKLNYVYVGNIYLKDYQDTKCSRCGKTVIRRSGYRVERRMLTEQGHCAHCGNKIVSH